MMLNDIKLNAKYNVLQCEIIIVIKSICTKAINLSI